MSHDCQGLAKLAFRYKDLATFLKRRMNTYDIFEDPDLTRFIFEDGSCIFMDDIGIWHGMDRRSNDFGCVPRPELDLSVVWEATVSGRVVFQGLACHFGVAPIPKVGQYWFNREQAFAIAALMTDRTESVRTWCNLYNNILRTGVYSGIASAFAGWCPPIIRGYRGSKDNH